MICLIKDWITKPRRVISLSKPRGMILVTGASREMIDARFDAANRMTYLIVHTCQKSLM